MKSFPQKIRQFRTQRLTHDLNKTQAPCSSPAGECVLLNQEGPVRHCIAHRDGSMIAVARKKFWYISKTGGGYSWWVHGHTRFPSFTGVYRQSEHEAIMLYFDGLSYFVGSIYIGIDYFRTMIQLQKTPYSLGRISDTEFVVGFTDGAIRFYTHQNGRKTKLERSICGVHSDYINHIEVHRNLMVAVSDCKTVSVWNTITKKRVAMLPHRYSVLNAVVNMHFIVTSSFTEVRVFENKPGYCLRYVFRRRHRNLAVEVVGDSFLLLSDNSHHISVVSLGKKQIVQSVKTSLPQISHLSLTRDGHVIVGSCLVINADQETEKSTSTELNRCAVVEFTEGSRIREELKKEASCRFGIQ